MAKVKRMMFGGAAKAAVGAAKGMGKLASQMGAQMQTQRAQMKSAPPRPGRTPTDLINEYTAQKSGKMGTGSQAASAAAALRKLPMNPPRPGTAGPKPMQPAMQKVDTSTRGPALQKFSNPQGYKQAESAYKQMQQQKQLANSVGRPSSGTAGPKPMQTARNAPTQTGLGDAIRRLGVGAAGAARGIAGSDLKRAGLMKKGGAVKKATKK